MLVRVCLGRLWMCFNRGIDGRETVLLYMTATENKLNYK